MGEIRRLEKTVYDKIAAGEVVERPVSVIKELVENAIDADASAISITISGGGVRSMVVTDNGSGIRAGDVFLAFEKHATSKISTIHDLDRIHTQGFRGEALSSIAAVSIAEMKTKRRDEDVGTRIRISGGQPGETAAVGIPDGTTVTVSNLFFNVPARLKFLKSESQEAAMISDLISRYILCYPEISFHYISQDKTVYHSSGDGNLRHAVYTVYGDMLDSLCEVSAAVNDIHIAGFVSRPGTSMKSGRGGSVFVNRRYVRNVSFAATVRSAYGETVVKGETPFYLLFIDMPSSSVDVNVHPNKLQVRFRDAAAVEYVMKEAISQVCAQVRAEVRLPSETQPLPQRTRVAMESSPEVIQTQLFSGFKPAVLRETEVIPAPSEPLYPSSHTQTDIATVEQVTGNTASEMNNLPETAVHSPSPATITPPAGYRLIGSFADTYILVEQEDNLLIIDQHAAHERLLYERFKSGTVPLSQSLLMPRVISVSHEQMNLIENEGELLASLGFDIEPFGALQLKVSAVPSVAFGASVEDLVGEALDEARKGVGDVMVRREAIIRAACRSAVKAGDKLSDAELRSIVENFLATNVMPTCPHGRPVISVLSKKSVEKSFKRIV
jgi:DNA mismatch repair protein MutL